MLHRPSWNWPRHHGYGTNWLECSTTTTSSTNNTNTNTNTSPPTAPVYLSFLTGYGTSILFTAFNTIRPRQNGRHFADDTSKRIFMNKNVRISIKFVPKGLINNIPALVQIMAWRRPDDKPLSEPMMVNLLTHICVTRPQWVKMSWLNRRPFNSLFNNFHRLTKQYNSELQVFRPCEGNPLVTNEFISQGVSNGGGISRSWLHHVIRLQWHFSSKTTTLSKQTCVED